MKKFTTRFIVLVGLLAAIAIVLKVFLGIPIHFAGGLIKELNLSPAIIMYAGIMFGPLVGGIVGGLADLLSFLISPLGAYIPFFTLTNILMGVVPALFFLKKDTKKSVPRIILATATSHVVYSVILNTLILIGMGFLTWDVAWLRGVASLLSLPVYCIIISLLVRYSQKPLAHFVEQQGKN